MGSSTKALVASTGVLILTVVHHLYGAVIYATPWRHHVALIVVPVLVALIIAHYVHRRYPAARAGAVGMYAFATLTAVFPVGLIGLFEGGYNHLLKNLLYFSGVAGDVMQRLFPPGRYEMPNDIIFEGTGILQFAIAVAAAYYTFQHWRQWRRKIAAEPVPAVATQ